MNDALENNIPGQFSLVLGGPLYQFFTRARLNDDTLGFARRRVIVVSLLCWLPLLLLSLLPDQVVGKGIKVPFFYDIEVHIRFLLAMPLLLVAELVVHQRFRILISQFVERGIVTSELLPQFYAIIRSAIRIRNSVTNEVLLIAVVFTAGHYLWSSQIALETATWFSPVVDGQHQFSPAGFWYAYVSLPVFQFLLYRWYFRMMIWTRFLWQVSRIELHLVPTHPDRAGGLGFLGACVGAFMPLILAHGVLVAGMIANRIFYEGATILDFEPEIGAALILSLLLVLGPLCVFASRLAQVKRKGLLEYGALASRYVSEFEDKWLRGAAPRDEALVGSADIQSLNDLAGSFEIVQGMRVFPFDRATVLQTVVVSLLPLLPLALTMTSFEELMKKLLGVLL